MEIVLYNDPNIEYYCSVCGIQGELDISDRISDDCAVDIDVICERCNDMSVLYFTKSVSPSLIGDLKYQIQKMLENQIL